jgi:ferredoxin
MNVDIDSSRCEGHAQCVVAAPDLFDLDDNGFGRPLRDGLTEHELPAARRAALACPVAAITIHGH